MDDAVRLDHGNVFRFSQGSWPKFHLNIAFNLTSAFQVFREHIVEPGNLDLAIFSFLLSISNACISGVIVSTDKTRCTLPVQFCSINYPIRGVEGRLWGAVNSCKLPLSPVIIAAVRFHRMCTVTLEPWHAGDNPTR